MSRRVFSNNNKNVTGTVIIRFLFIGTQKASPHNEVIQPFQIIFWGMVKLKAEREERQARGEMDTPYRKGS